MGEEAIASLVGAGVSAAGTAASITMGGKMNQKAVRQAIKTRDWQTKEREAQNQWNLEQWNRQNEYNSPAQAAARLEAAGFSPLAALEGQGGMANAPAEGATDPSGTMPNFVNPASNIGSMVNQTAQQFNEYIRLQNDTKRVQNETARTQSEIDYKTALTDTENQLRAGKFEMLGVEIDLRREQAGKTADERKGIAQQINESQTKVAQMLQFMQLQGVQIDAASWDLYAKKKKLPYELRMFGAQIAAANATTEYTKNAKRSLQLQNYRDEVYNTDYFDSDLKNRMDEQAFRTGQSEEAYLQSRGKTKSRYLYVVDKAMDSISNIIQPFVSIFQGYMFSQIGKAKGIPVAQPSSIRNYDMSDWNKYSGGAPIR